MKNKEVQKIYDELIDTYQNLKAEVFVTEIIENSDLDLTDIDILNQSTFSRSYRRDVINFKLDTHSSKTDKLQFSLARNGIYDTLPEGLFHAPVKSKSSITYKELRQKHKTEEKDARNFFTPIENEFFTQKVNIEQNERNLINKFSDFKNNFLLEFWDLQKDIPNEYSIRLMQLLPYTHRISGDMELTALSLEKIIGEKVTIKETKKHLKDIKKQDNDLQQLLGVDLVLDLRETNIYYPGIEIIIGPVTKENIDKYVEGGVTKKFISIFCDFFVPMEIETEINVAYSDKERTFVLNEVSSPRMGLTTII
ncbi:hypothetical protein [Aquimarina sp. MMG016]|uniref:hypothetical protein n=1 Tax=Aquimarina sp. MMG016 TaxID=2822690 RepID=UPI001B3A57AF|nr:hypothetical protein [Aquimarina sp. MMG016]MBQ4821282.1 hypothetical protein [Aquimarina sp. MMG016]